jgi:hypothetical protein
MRTLGFFITLQKEGNLQILFGALKMKKGGKSVPFQSFLVRKRHFQKIFSDQGEATIAEVFRTVQCFPRFIEEDEAEDLQSRSQGGG